MKYGLVMSGGGARGYAHIGVLQALHEKNIFPGMLAGTSAGAIVGALYADGKSPGEIFSLLQKNELHGKVNFFHFQQGFLRHEKLKRLLQDHLSVSTFEDLKIPLYVNATNYRSGREMIFHEGTIIDKVIASAAIPIIFEPVKISGIPYVDGALSDNLPAHTIRDKCEVLIGVNVNPVTSEFEKNSLSLNIDRTLHIGINHLVRPKIEMCDIFIEPAGLAAFGIFDAEKIEAIYDVGYSAAKKTLENL